MKRATSNSHVLQRLQHTPPSLLFIPFTLILSTLASSFSCSTSRRMLDKLELEVMLVKIVLGNKNS